MSNELEKMEDDMREVRATLDKLMFTLNGTEGVPGLVLIIKELSTSAGKMVGEIAHLFRFKKRIEDSIIGQEKKEREKLQRELEIQRLTLEKEKMEADATRYRRESRNKNWILVGTLAFNLLIFILNKYIH